MPFHSVTREKLTDPCLSAVPRSPTVAAAPGTHPKCPAFRHAVAVVDDDVVVVVAVVAAAAAVATSFPGWDCTASCPFPFEVDLATLTCLPRAQEYAGSDCNCLDPPLQVVVDLAVEDTVREEEPHQISGLATWACSFHVLHPQMRPHIHPMHAKAVLQASASAYVLCGTAFQRKVTIPFLKLTIAMSRIAGKL